jgi:hypothetical protein
MIRFTIGTTDRCGRQGIRTLTPRGGALVSTEARPTVSGYLPSEPIGLTGSRTRGNPSGVAPARDAGVVPLDQPPLVPIRQVDRPGSRTPISCLQGRRLPVGPAAHRSPAKVRPGLEPGPPPYRGGMPPVTPADRNSRPGRTRTCGILLVRQASWPLDDGTKSSSRGGSRTHKHQPLRLAALPFAYPAIGRVAGMGVEPHPTEFMRLGRAPAHPRVPGPGIEPGGRPHEGRPGARRAREIDQ